MRLKLTYILLISSLFLMTSCQAIGDIFKAGVWVGIIGVVLVVGLIFYIIGKLRG
jgi:hypothetical protein